MDHVKTRIYYTGGCGMNLGSEYSPTSESVCFLDSSAANNKRSQIDGDRLYIIPNTDGAGGDVAYMMPHAKAHVKPMLEKFPPAEQNIIVTSGGGGTGPAITAALVTELLKNGENLTVVVIGGYDTTRRVRNTINLIKNIELQVARNSQCASLVYISNAAGETPADDEALFSIEALDALMDQENDRMDTRDLSNFINFNRIAAVEPQLALMQIFDNRQAAASVIEPISVAVLVDDISKDIPYGTAFARTVGITPRADKLPTGQMHYVLNTVGITDVMAELEETLVKLNTAQSSFRQRKATFVQADLGEEELFLN